MFESFAKLPIGHDLNNSKLRTRDVLLDENVKFSSLLLEEKIQNGLSKCGYVLLSPIQKNALPSALTGTSLIAHSKSGTGKTLVFLLSALNICLKTKSKSLQCLVLTPTREIAKQVYDIFKNVSCFIEDLNIEYFIGGIPLDLDTIKCRNCQIAIGAPGRIKHLIELGELKVQELKLLVLDEVDMLLNHKEFAVLELVNMLPRPLQTIVCTATFSENIKELLKPISPDIKYVTTNDDSGSSSCASTSNILIGVKQYVASVFSDSTSMDSVRKRNKLVDILQNFKYEQCFIFVNYICIVKSLCNFLTTNNLPALWVSSEQNQSTRIATLNKLKMNECRILVTTDLAARGIDVHNVDLVINLGVPSPPEVYIHRMGRAGRYGSKGAVITVVYEGEEMTQFKRIVSAVSTDPVDLYILDNEVSSLCHDQDFKIIKCQPQHDPELTEEYLFRKKINAAQRNAPTKKKSKKHKKKKQPVKAVEVPVSPVVNVKLPETVEEEVIDSDCLTDESKPPRISSSSDNHVMEKMIQQYVETVKEHMSRTISLDESVIGEFFLRQMKTYTKMYFADYVKPPNLTEAISKQETTQEPDLSVLNFVNSIRGKNSFLDEQKIPCSMAQFFELYDSDETILTNYTPVGFTDIIKDMLSKVRELARPLISQHSQLGAENTNTSVSKTFLKRVGGKCNQFSDMYGRTSMSKSEDTEDSSGILQETSNWVLGHMNSVHSPKRTKKDEPVEFDPGPNNTLGGMKYIPFASTSMQPHSGFIKPIPIVPEVNRTIGISRTIYEHNSEPNHDLRSEMDVNVDVPMPSSLRSRKTNNKQQDFTQQKTSNPNIDCVQCPNCQFKFSAVSSINQGTPILQPMRAFVNSDMERNIWQSHFHFIGNHVRSLPSIFGNR